MHCLKCFIYKHFKLCAQCSLVDVTELLSLKVQMFQPHNKQTQVQRVEDLTFQKSQTCFNELSAAKQSNYKEQMDQPNMTSDLKGAVRPVVVVFFYFHFFSGKTRFQTDFNKYLF